MKQREIKFRAWHINTDRMLNPLTDTGLLFQTILQAPSYIVMQYIGLKDKNGKEIYEGDIIAVDNENDVITVCKYETGCFILEDKCYGHWTRQLHNQPERLKIIGNIYENPELLKKQ